MPERFLANRRGRSLFPSPIKEKYCGVFGGSRRTFSIGAVIAPRKVYRKPNKFRDGDEAPQEFSALHAGLKVLGLCVAKGSASLDKNPCSINWDVLT